MKKKSLALLVALVLVVGCVIGGTLAWLTAQSDPVVNTFSTSDINVELKENTGPGYKMIPGYTISKDPQVTVLSGSEECYLFVKLDESANFDDYMTYEIADGWKKLDGVADTVYYREVKTADIGTSYSVLEGNQVTVKDTVTKKMMETAEQNNPTLTITAYASQLHKNADETFDAETAWKNIASE